jgi:hypothetical protein
LTSHRKRFSVPVEASFACEKRESEHIAPQQEVAALRRSVISWLGANSARDQYEIWFGQPFSRGTGAAMSENDKTSPPDIRDPDWLLRRIHKFRKEVQHVEREYLELRTLLRDAEAALRSDPEDEEMRIRVHYLKGRIEDLEKRHAWLVSGKAPEIAFWAPPAG